MLLALLALAFAVQAPAGAPAPPPVKPQLICRRGEQLVGTHIRTGKRCKTAEQWQQEDSKREAPAPSLRVTEGQNDGLPLKRPQ